MNADARIPAATYVRMSTEHQQYSTSNQLDTIVVYAERRGFVIVREFSDEGKSGLNIQGRGGLTRMIEMVKAVSRISKRSSSTMSAAGAASRTQTKAPITNTSADGPASRFTIAQSSSKTTAASVHRSSKQ